jgi:hypothetical protein
MKTTTTAQHVIKAVAEAKKIAVAISKTEMSGSKWALTVAGDTVLGTEELKEIKLQLADVWSEGYIKKMFASINILRTYADKIDISYCNTIGFVKLYDYLRGIKSPVKADTVAGIVEDVKADTVEDTVEDVKADTVEDVREVLNVQRNAVVSTAKYPTLTLFDESVALMRETLREMETKGTLTDVMRDKIEAHILAYENSFFDLVG